MSVHRRRPWSDALRPCCAAVFPSIVEIDVVTVASITTKDDDLVARGVENHPVTLSRRWPRRGGLRPRESIPLPRVRKIVGRVPTEKDRHATNRVIGHGVVGSRRRSSNRAAYPGVAVPFPGVADRAAAE